uniref:Uncharacterized protein n=1 Tax=Arundo donax TaxID=35708 RepID=A0A0A9HCK6_ARUDO
MSDLSSLLSLSPLPYFSLHATARHCVRPLPTPSLSRKKKC